MAFNPVKEETINSKYTRVVWTTESLEMAVKALGQGRRLVANPFLDNNVLLLKPELVYARTAEEKQEWLRCREDIIYFVEKYCKIMTPEGIQHVTLRDYQKGYLELLQRERLTIYCSARQSGKTVTSALYMLHYLLFNIDKTAMILGNRRKTSVEILDKMKSIFFHLPYFIKAGIYKWNEGEIVLDNGCRCICDATTETPAISFTIHCLLWDEAAHIRDSIADTFYGNIFPTLQASHGKMMITSTTNGRNLFYRLFSAAKAHESDFAAYEVTWDMIPEWNAKTLCWEKRDEDWRKRQIANLGSLEQFNKQFGTDFDIGANTLVSNKAIKSVEAVRFVPKDLTGVTQASQWFWHPDINPDDLRSEHIVITCDLSEGIGQDYTVFSIFRLVDEYTLELIGYFRSNTTSRRDYTRSLMLLCTKKLHPSKYLVSLELNTYGEIFLRDLADLGESEIPLWDPSVLVKYYNESGSRFVQGIKITPGNKSAHCILFKEAFETHHTLCADETFVYELQNFCDSGNGKFAASYGHDDMIMTAVQLEFVRKTLQFRLLCDELDRPESTSDTIWNPYDGIDIVDAGTALTARQRILGAGSSL